MYDLGLCLKELRKNKNLTQEQVAKRLNMHKSTIFNYESNYRKSSTDVIVQLAIFYNVTTDYLLGVDNKKIIRVNDITDNELEIIELLLANFRKNRKSENEIKG